MARETIIFAPLILSLRDNIVGYSHRVKRNLAIKTFPSSLDREENMKKLDRICRWSKEKVETKEVYGIIVVELSEIIFRLNLSLRLFIELLARF